MIKIGICEDEELQLRFLERELAEIDFRYKMGNMGLGAILNSKLEDYRRGINNN